MKRFSSSNKSSCLFIYICFSRQALLQCSLWPCGGISSWTSSNIQRGLLLAVEKKYRGATRYSNCVQSVWKKKASSYLFSFLCFYPTDFLIIVINNNVAILIKRWLIPWNGKVGLLGGWSPTKVSDSEKKTVSKEQSHHLHLESCGFG